MERPEGPQQGKAVAFGKRQIEDEDVRTSPVDELERLLVGGSLADDLEAIDAAEDEPETFADEMVVIDERDPDRPLPGPRRSRRRGVPRVGRWSAGDGSIPGSG
jgi:hypothetical protein